MVELEMYNMTGQFMCCFLKIKKCTAVTQLYGRVTFFPVRPCHVFSGTAVYLEVCVHTHMTVVFIKIEFGIFRFWNFTQSNVHHRLTPRGPAQ